MTSPNRPAYRIVEAKDGQQWPCTIVDNNGRSVLATVDRTPVPATREIADRMLAALNQPSDAQRDWEALCALARRHGIAEDDVHPLDTIARALDDMTAGREALRDAIAATSVHHADITGLLRAADLAGLQPPTGGRATGRDRTDA